RFSRDWSSDVCSSDLNGATGFTGKVAVQVAKHYGAGKIIATGRNERTLQSLLALGADEMVPLQQQEEAMVAQIRDLHRASPVDRSEERRVGTRVRAGW